MKLAHHDHMRSVERAYLQMVTSILPRFPVFGGNELTGELFFVDMLDTADPLLKAMPVVACANAQREDAEDGLRLRDILTRVSADSYLHRGDDSAPTIIAKSVQKIRHAFRPKTRGSSSYAVALQCLHEERRHPVSGSAFEAYAESLKLRLGAKQPWVPFEGYIRHVRFTEAHSQEALQALVTEVAVATRHRQTAEITPELVASLSPVMLPFTALGVLRGGAVWWPTDDVERTALCKGLADACVRNHLVGRLSATYSGAVIDVFAAYLLRQLDATDAAGDARTEVVLRALRYLFPCTSVEPVDPLANPERGTVTLEFLDEDIVEFTGLEAVRWTIDPTFYIAPDASNRMNPDAPDENNPHLRLVELKLRDVALAASRAVERHYDNAAYIFGHDLKNRLQELGHGAARRRLLAGEPGAVEGAARVLEKLDVFYGTAELFRGVGKMRAGQLPSTWVAADSPDWPAGLSAAHLDETEASLHAIVRNTVRPYVQTAAFELRQLLGTERHRVDLDVEVDWKDLRIPPLASGATPAGIMALTAGLMEIVRNAVRHVVDSANQPDIIADYGLLHLDYAVTRTATELHVQVWNPTLGTTIPSSKTIERLAAMYRNIEAVSMEAAVFDPQHALSAGDPHRYARADYRIDIGKLVVGG